VSGQIFVLVSAVQVPRIYVFCRAAAPPLLAACRMRMPIEADSLAGRRPAIRFYVRGDLLARISEFRFFSIYHVPCLYCRAGDLTEPALASTHVGSLGGLAPGA
jgi:hypothetical protein